MKLRFFLAALFPSAILTGAEFTVPQTAQAPVIDGKITPGEWKDVLVISGAGATVDHRKAELTCREKVKTAKNLETGKTLSVSGNRITFPLKKHDFILIEAELE